MRKLLILAAVAMLAGCVSVRRYNSAIAVAYYTGVVRGMTEISRIYHLGMSRAEVNQTVDDTMDTLAAEAAYQTDQEVGPPPDLSQLHLYQLQDAMPLEPPHKTELPSRGRKDAR